MSVSSLIRSPRSPRRLLFPTSPVGCCLQRRSLLLANAGLLALAALTAAQPTPTENTWTQWGGAHRDFTVDAPPLAESWPETGPPQLWSRPLGVGHSTILAEDGLLFTIYREGDGQSRSGPWALEEAVIALDAATGETRWEFSYPSPIEDFGRGAGPHSTPLLVADRLFAIGTNRRLHALDKWSGELLWSVDLVADLGAPPLQVRPVVKSGYSSSPIAHRDLILCFAGGPGQSVVALRQSDGSVAWRSGHFLISGASPLMIEVGGEQQVVFFGGSLAAGLDPDDGAVLWAWAHDAGNDFNLSMPLWGEDRVLFLSSAYRAGSRALRLRREGAITEVEELWFDNRIKFQFLNAVRVGDVVYGTHGESGTAFLMAVDVESGEILWRQRGFGQSTLVHADDKLIVLTEDGELALVRASREGAEELARAALFDTTSWAAPTLVGTTLYARDREKVLALDLGPSNGSGASSDGAGGAGGVR
ncbi:MAG TPA: PQQ-binding-like beta-propeller repeat protein [Thermoanaerobaculia bacterium]|nr:PQQ-binding-like beta-propeller repeat protein [Thermoanaerobaculia bacterium]